MATITIQIVAGGTTYTRSKTISAGDLTRLVAAEKVGLGLSAGATDQQVFDAWAEDIYRLEKERIRTAERRSAEAAAISQISDIALS
jgi:hypothetical protein